MSFHHSLFSASRFTFPYVSRPVHSHTSFIYDLLGAPTFLFPSTLPSKICKCVTPLDPLNKCPAYLRFLFIISFKKCSCICNLFRTSLLVTLSFQLIFSSFCNTTSQKHSLSIVMPYSMSNTRP